MAKNKSRLGRGLSSLLSVPDGEPVDFDAPPAVTAPSPPTDGHLFHVELSRVHVNPHQPRRTFDEAALNGLAESLKQTGVIQPIVVRPDGADYQLIAGERRLRAAKLAGLTHLPALLRQASSAEQAELALVENIHRADLNPLERAQAYQELREHLNLTQEQLATRLGEDRSTIANHVRLLDLCEPARQQVAAGALSLGHAKVLAGIHDLLEQHRWGERTVAEQLTVRQLENAIRDAKLAKSIAPPPPASAHLADLERRLSRDLQMRVQVRHVGKRGQGRVVIHYASLDQFDDLVNRLGLTAGD